MLLRKLLIPILAVAILLSACAPVSLRPPGTPFILGGRLVTATPSNTPEPTFTPSPTPLDVPDLSGQSVPLILLCDKSGPLAATDAARIAAVEAMAASINASGGLFGAQLDLQVGDTRGTVDGAETAEARLRREVEDVSLIIICDELTQGAVSETLNEDGIPALAPGAFAAEDGQLFGFDASPSQHLAYFIEDLAANWAQRRPAGAGAEIRLAILSWPAEMVGQAATPELLAYAESLGIEIVLQAELAPETNANSFDFIYDARDKNVNVIYINARSFGLAETLNAVSNLGLRERFVLGAPAIAYDTDFYSYLADPAFAEGIYLTSAWAWWAEENPGVERARALLGDDWTDWSFLPLAGSVDLARRVFEDILIDGSVTDITPQSVSGALENLAGYPVLDAVYVIDYASGQRTLQQLRTWQAGPAAGELILLNDYAPIPDLSLPLPTQQP